jgi:signal transduction histidine kinase
MGIPPNDLKKVFEPFWRSERTKELAISGTGLGLSLSKDLAQKYNIQLTLSSPGENQGAIAKIAWPLYKA